MTDKEIIIDGVDVAECVCYATSQAVATLSGVIVKDIDNACTPRQRPCAEIKNCMFKKLSKQLARKTEECEKWKSYYDLYRFDQELLKKIQGVINSHPKYGIELTDTCIIDKDERLSSLEIHEQIKLIFDETLQEYEALKEDYKELEHRHNEAFQDFERLKQEYEELKQYKASSKHLRSFENS